MSFKPLAIILLLFVVSCSSNKKNEDKARFASIDLDSNSTYEKVEPLIKSSSLSKTENVAKLGKVKNIIGIVFGPGINRSIGYIPVVKYLNKNEVPYHVVMGSGMGAVFAAYVAMGKSHNQIEWDFYQLFRKLEGETPYSSDWISILDKEMLSKFKGIKIQELKKMLIIPLLDKKNNEQMYFHQGDLYLALKYNFQFVTKQKAQRFISSLKSSPFNINNVQNFGVDTWFGFDVLGEELSFDKIGDDYLIGVLGRQISLRKDEEENYKEFYSLPISKMPLDAVKSVPKYLKETDKEAKNISNSIKEILKDEYDRE